MNLANHLVRCGRAHRDRPAVASGTEVVLDYGSLADRAGRIAGAFVESHGLEPGDRVAIAMTNTVHYLEVLYGCWHAGLVAVPINAKLHGSEFRHILDNSGARVCMATSDLMDTISALDVDGLERIVEVAGDEYARMLATGPRPPETRQPEDPAWLFYTSGTTGVPKGAVLTHRNLMAMIFCYLADVDPGAPWRAILHAAPMSHGSGLYGLAHVTQGSCHVYPHTRGFDPSEIYSLVRSWPDLCFFAAPTMVKRLVDHAGESDTRNLKLIIYGGGPMYVEDCVAAIDRFGPKLSQLYGQGESPMTITALNAGVHADRRHPRWRERLASVGIPQSAVEVRVADAEDNALPREEAGEILVRGDSVMAGYWRNREASDQALRNGWLHTGDIGSFDEDGFLTLKDRSKDLIISGGANIYPREVEEALIRHPDVSEVSVIGRPDREWGEVVVAYVVARPGSGVNAQALDSHCVDCMARFKRPKDYRFVDELPKNNYGKILKTVLRAQHGD